MLIQGFLDRSGKHRDSVLFPFAVSDHDLVLGEVEVFDPQAAAGRKAADVSLLFAGCWDRQEMEVIYALRRC